MAYLFSDLQTEIKQRATRAQAGTAYDTTIKNIINTSLFRIGREAPWRSIRKKTYFTTKTSYTEGSGAGTFTEDSASISITGATFLTDTITIGRRIKLSGDSRYFIIRQITSETDITLDRLYSGTTTTTGTYSILGQEEYNLPIQAGHRLFLWHEEYGYPYKLEFIPDQTFIEDFADNTTEAIPTHYRMWGEDMVKEQPRQASVVRVYSSSSADKSVGVTIFGTVSGYPDYEEVSTNASDGTTAVSGTKSFSSIERVTKDATTTGRITVDANTAATTIAVLPTGDSTAGIVYRKIQLYPLPNSAFDINVYYYKDPYRLVNDDDVHELGQAFDEAIILLSVAKIKYEDSQKEGDKWFALYKDEIRSLKKTNVDKLDWFPTLRRPTPGRNANGNLARNLRYSQIGAYYGPSSRR